MDRERKEREEIGRESDIKEGKTKQSSIFHESLQILGVAVVGVGVEVVVLVLIFLSFLHTKFLFAFIAAVDRTREFMMVFLFFCWCRNWGVKDGIVLLFWSTPLELLTFSSLPWVVLNSQPAGRMDPH